MTKRKKFGAALLAVLALAILPAAVFHISPNVIAMFLCGAAGAFTITYESFQHTGAYGGNYTGGTTAPTQAQSAQTSLITALVNFTDTDTLFTLTHNWNLSAAQLAALLPLITINVAGSVQALGTAVQPVIAITTRSANTITFTKLQATGSGLTVQVDMRRPHSLGF